MIPSQPSSDGLPDSPEGPAQAVRMEDHPRHRKWDPVQMAYFWLIDGGDPNHLLTGMILQVWGWSLWMGDVNKCAEWTA